MTHDRCQDVSWHVTLSWHGVTPSVVMLHRDTRHVTVTMLWQISRRVWWRQDFLLNFSVTYLRIQEDTLCVNTGSKIKNIFIPRYLINALFSTLISTAMLDFACSKQDIDIICRNWLNDWHFMTFAGIYPTKVNNSNYSGSLKIRTFSGQQNKWRLLSNINLKIL